MSCYEWERGTLILPSAEATRLKKAVRDATNREHDRIYEASRSWWRKNGRRYVAAFKRDRWTEAHALERSIPDGCYDAIDTGRTENRMPRHEDVFPPRATNKDTSFWAGRYQGEGHITFAGRAVTWSVSENNHACESARGGAVAAAFFAALSRIKWTRGTGGVIVGNNEYNRDSESAGGGGNYIVAAYGPKGDEAQAREMGITVRRLRESRTVARVTPKRDPYSPYARRAY
jgi:hypothetical protein